MLLTKVIIIVSQIFLLWIAFLPLIVSASYDYSKSDSASSKPIWFSGYEWEIKNGRDYPGENDWAEDNVWLDDAGYLHLKISKKTEHWYCAELASVRSFGYGVYQFQVIGQIDKLDPNIVLGLFVYPCKGTSTNSPNEIDIEFAQWGKNNAPHGNYTVTPDTNHFLLSLEGNYTFHQFSWRPDQIFFQSFYGHVPKDRDELSHWSYIPKNYAKIGPAPPVRVHMNLWLYLGNPPVDGQEREVVVRSFVFVPMR